jgi:glycosyltransferase involved in cell wall biosynthesis
MPAAETPAVELSIVMPCLNEAETLAVCVEKALNGLKSAGISGEVIVADNGSTDGSIEIARKHGARVVNVTTKGYGNALRGGIEVAKGRWIIMGDADDSYDFGEAGRFMEKLREGHDLVMGCRLPKGGGTIKPGAMPWKNRWIGNPSLSFIGRLFFKTPVRDFHCGLRGFSRDAYDRMELKTTGMEFASEMVMKASLRSMRISEVPITLHPDGRSRPPHLRPWRDGWRHLRFMLIYSPRWLFLVPGLILTAIGSLAAALIFLAPRHLGGIEFDAGSLLVACMGAIVGVQLVAFACFTKAFAIGEGLLPEDPKFGKALKLITLERGLIVGLLISIAGGCLLAWSIYLWGKVNFGSLPYPENLRRLIIAVTLIVIGLQTVFSSFFLGVLGLKTANAGRQ